MDGVTTTIRCPVYTFNLAGYQAAHLPSGGNRFTFGGLTDNAFSAIEQLEASRQPAAILSRQETRQARPAGRQGAAGQCGLGAGLLRCWRRRPLAG